MTLETLTRFLDKYNLPWLTLAILSWIIIYFTFTRIQFYHILPIGIWTMVIGSLLEVFFINNKFWVEKFIMIHIGELDLFVIAGPFFFLGMVMIRFLPENLWLKYLSILFWSCLATGMEAVATKLGFLMYSTKWSAFHSIGIYYLALLGALGFYYIYNGCRIVKY